MDMTKTTSSGTTSTEDDQPLQAPPLPPTPSNGGSGPTITLPLHPAHFTATFPESTFTFGNGAGGYVGTLRRVKPLPRSKRRRMSDEEGAMAAAATVAVGYHPAPGLPATWTAALPATMPGGYPLVGGGVMYAAPPPPAAAGEVVGEGDATTGDDDEGATDDRDRGDQQGNTKKRKVPAAAHHGHGRGGSSSDEGDAFFGGGGGVGNGGDGLQDDGSVGGAHCTLEDWPTTTTTKGSQQSHQKTPQPRMSISTVTALKLKEIAAMRKRLLSGVLGAAPPASSTESMPTVEEVALEIALAAPLKWPSYVSLPPNITSQESLASARKRRALQRMRKKKVQPKSSEAGGAEPRQGIPNRKFTLEISSPSSERVKATLAEIASLRTKFAQELARISAKQAEAARKAAAAAAQAAHVAALSNPTSKTTAGPMTKKISEVGSKAGSSPGVKSTGTLDGAGGGGTSSTKKKKKRGSNRANDPHQIRNYIPSRLPSGTGATQPPTPAQAAQNLKSLISPHPVQFLSAEPLPSGENKKKKKSTSSKTTTTKDKENAKPTVTSSLPPVQPMDEWICSFCEFNLFYGDDSAFRRAVRARKSLLSRRRRARERAAAAASGQGKLLGTNNNAEENDEESEEDGDGEDEDGEEQSVPEEEQEAKFVDPAEVDARVEASMGGRKPVVRDKPPPPLPSGAGIGTSVSGAKAA